MSSIASRVHRRRSPHWLFPLLEELDVVQLHWALMNIVQDWTCMAMGHLFDPRARSLDGLQVLIVDVVRKNEGKDHRDISRLRSMADTPWAMTREHVLAALDAASRSEKYKV
jgi:hypothetical protein